METSSEITKANTMRESTKRGKCDAGRGNKRNKLKCRGGNKLGVATLWARAATSIDIRPITLTKLSVAILKNHRK